MKFAAHRVRRSAEYLGRGTVAVDRSLRRVRRLRGNMLKVCRRTNEMHRTQDSYESVSCNCRGACSLEASARAWGVGDLECRSAAKPCRLPVMFCGEALQAICYVLRRKSWGY